MSRATIAASRAVKLLRPMKIARSSVLVAGFLALLGVPLACSHGSDARRTAHPAARVLLIGVDGLEWKVLRPLLEQGRCKNLRGLMERGSFGCLATMTPTLSPILWTTIATGRAPVDHGILGFTDQDLQQYSSAERRTRAVWNIADRYGLKCDVFGWWITWPAEAIRGAMVSGSSSSALVDTNWKPALLPGVPGQVVPESLTREVLDIAERTGSHEEVRRLAREKVFGDLPEAELGSVEKRLIQETLWSIQSDATYCAIARQVMRERPADLSMVYLGGPDVIGHRFWRYYEPARYRWPEGPGSEERWQKISPGSPPLRESLAGPLAAAALARAIPSYYEWIDEMIGELAQAAGPDAAVIVCSDHGMHAASTEDPNPKFITGHHLDGPPGVIVAAGPGILHGKGMAAFLAGEEPPALGDVLAITPTLLALLGIPPALTMPEPAIESILDGNARANASLPPVATHDEGFRAPARVEMPPEMNENFRERYRQLGYLGSETDPGPASIPRGNGK